MCAFAVEVLTRFRQTFAQSHQFAFRLLQRVFEVAHERDQLHAIELRPGFCGLQRIRCVGALAVLGCTIVSQTLDQRRVR